MVTRWVVVLALAGCIEPDLVLCGDGRACAPSQVCDPVHTTCVLPEQLVVCAGQADQSPCSTGVVDGLCFDDVCLEPGCGNHAVDPGEQCDDGNDGNDDGCSADCRSNESCNNGVRDPGEACDDGNRVSHDGCSSRCEVETLEWSTIPVSPYSPTYAAAYDQDRHRLVVARPHTTWEWDGTTWTLSRDAVVGVGWSALVWDSDHGKIIGIGTIGVSQGVGPDLLVPVVYTWDGTAWSESVATPPDSFSPGTAAYDPARRVIQVLALNGTTTMTFDPQAAAWSVGAPLPFTPDGSERMAFDAARGKLMLVGAGGTCEPSGAIWDCLFTFPPGGGMLVYDTTRGEVIALATNGEAYGYVSPQWLATGIVMPNKVWKLAWQDATTQTIGLIGPDSSYAVSGTTVSARTEPPLENARAVYEPSGDRLLAVDTANGVWRRDATAWTSVAAPASNVSRGPIIFDPVRGGVLAVNKATKGVWLFTTSWTQIVPDGGFAPDAPSYVLAYDYGRQRPIHVQSGLTSVLEPTAQWLVVGPAPQVVAASYDATIQRLIGTAYSGPMVSLEFPTWVPGLPLSGYQPVAWPEARTTLLVPLSYAVDLPILELVGQSVTVHDPMPQMDAALEAAIAWSRGRTVIRAVDGGAVLLLVRQLVSATPDESCVDGEDLDADGASSCADPDCWQHCFPACPLATSSCL